MPRDKELAETVDIFLLDTETILEFLDKYFSDENGILRFTRGKIDLAERVAFEEEYVAVDIRAASSRRLLNYLAPPTVGISLK